jgi:hypothetical protein
MLSVDMLLRQVTLFLVDSDGIAMGYQSNTKSIRNTISRTGKKFLKWESSNTIADADLLS